MDVPNDFRELLESFNAHRVEYLVVGAYALAFHGAPRATGDMDLFVKPDSENAERILAALEDFGLGSLDLKTEDFCAPDMVVQLGVTPVRVDLITTIDGVSWQEAWDSRAEGTIAGLPVSFISRAQFIANKRAAGRLKDLADLEALSESG